MAGGGGGNPSSGKLTNTTWIFETEDSTTTPPIKETNPKPDGKPDKPVDPDGGNTNPDGQKPSQPEKETHVYLYIDKDDIVFYGNVSWTGNGQKTYTPLFAGTYETNPANGSQIKFKFDRELANRNLWVNVQATDTEGKTTNTIDRSNAETSVYGLFNSYKDFSKGTKLTLKNTSTLTAEEAGDGQIHTVKASYIWKSYSLDKDKMSAGGSKEKMKDVSFTNGVYVTDKNSNNLYDFMAIEDSKLVSTGSLHKNINGTGEYKDSYTIDNVIKNNLPLSVYNGKVYKAVKDAGNNNIATELLTYSKTDNNYTFTKDGKTYNTKLADDVKVYGTKSEGEKFYLEVKANNTPEFYNSRAAGFPPNFDINDPTTWPEGFDPNDLGGNGNGGGNNNSNNGNNDNMGGNGNDGNGGKPDAEKTVTLDSYFKEIPDLTKLSNQTSSGNEKEWCYKKTDYVGKNEGGNTLLTFKIHYEVQSGGLKNYNYKINFFTEDRALCNCAVVLPCSIKYTWKEGNLDKSGWLDVEKTGETIKFIDSDKKTYNLEVKEIVNDSQNTAEIKALYVLPRRNKNLIETPIIGSIVDKTITIKGLTDEQKKNVCLDIETGDRTGSKFFQLSLHNSATQKWIKVTNIARQYQYFFGEPNARGELYWCMTSKTDPTKLKVIENKGFTTEYKNLNEGGIDTHRITVADLDNIKALTNDNKYASLVVEGEEKKILYYKGDKSTSMTMDEFNYLKTIYTKSNGTNSGLFEFIDTTKGTEDVPLGSSAYDLKGFEIEIGFSNSKGRVGYNLTNIDQIKINDIVYSLKFEQ